MADARNTSRLEAARADCRREGPGWEDPAADPALRPVVEAGGGEAEGFELAEQQLVERASHGDYQSAHAILHDRGGEEEPTMREDDDGDHEYSSELDEEGFDDYEDLDEEELDEREDEDED